MEFIEKAVAATDIYYIYVYVQYMYKPQRERTWIRLDSIGLLRLNPDLSQSANTHAHTHTRRFGIVYVIYTSRIDLVIAFTQVQCSMCSIAVYIKNDSIYCI